LFKKLKSLFVALLRSFGWCSMSSLTAIFAILVCCFISGFVLELFFMVLHTPSASVASSRTLEQQHEHIEPLDKKQEIQQQYVLRRAIPKALDENVGKAEVEQQREESVPTQQQQLQQQQQQPLITQKIDEKQETAGGVQLGRSVHQPVFVNFSHHEVPPIVKAWREAKLDWHLLLPTHNSQWERFGTPVKEGKLRMLVGKEVQVTDFLTQFHESGLSKMYGHNHGPLLAYSGCDAFVSACMIHDEEGCSYNQMCHWSQEESLCVEGVTVEAARVASETRKCSEPKRFNSQGNLEKVPNPTSDCKLWVSDPVIVVHPDGESQAMFYHWWASWQSILSHWLSACSSNRHTHFFIGNIQEPMFYTYFGLISDFCWRRTERQIPDGVCFCKVSDFPMSQTRNNPDGASAQMISFLGLDQVTPSEDRVKVGIISRRRKRFLLNEYDLVESIAKLGYDCELLPLESMTLYEQMRSLRSLDVLIGVHGSALDNSVFLHKGSVMVQLLPYKVEHRVTFQSSAVQAGVKYLEWQLRDQSKAVFHWDLMMAANSEKMARKSREDILKEGQVAADNRETTMFWINQDIIVPLDEFVPLVERAVKQSPAMARQGVMKNFPHLAPVIE